MPRDWEVKHYGPARWDGPAEKKHYSRHATLEAANTHARKLAHASLPKGYSIDHWNNADDPDDPSHSYYHVDKKNKELGDSLYVQKVGSQEKFEKDVKEGRAELDPGVMKPLLDFAFKKKSN